MTKHVMERYGGNAEDEGPMKYRKTIRVPVHYRTTQTKQDKLRRLTARITFVVTLINSLVLKDTKLDRLTLRKMTRDADVAKKSGLSAGYVDQCVDKVLWSWRSYKDKRNEWKYRYDRAVEALANAGDVERERLEKKVARLERNEPSPPVFRHKVSCRLDYRSGKIQPGGNTFPLYMHISTLKKGETMDVPLNPSRYHMKQLAEAEINDFEIIRKNGKYYAHITVTKRAVLREPGSFGGIDQGLNRSIATVLLHDPVPREVLLYDEKRSLLDKYDEIIASLQQAGKTRKLRSLRGKRGNVSVYHDWLLARKVADYTDGYMIAIGNTRFRQTQFRGNGMPGLRKRVGKWSYGRQRIFIALKRAEKGLPTLLVDEKNTSNTCHCCDSRLVQRKYHDGESWIFCHSCGAKLDADLNAAYNIALRCRDDRLKVRMNPAENRASA